VQEKKGGITMRNKALLTMVMLSIACFSALTAHAEERQHGHEGFGNRTILVRPYSNWGMGIGWGWAPYWGEYYPPYYPAPDYRGNVKISDHNKSDQVYINGALAGSVGETHNFKLKPGRYDIQIRQDGRQILNQQVYVISGKTIKLKVD
jgi:hypothetical protein